jgi:hypothetical protein
VKKYDFHPIANAFPLMEGDEFSELCGDVETHGVREQGVLLDGLILDGRNRYRAAAAEHVEMSFRKFDASIDGESPIEFVISANLRRRHLDASQRAMAAAKIANLENGRRKAAAHECAAVSQEQAADTFGVSRRAVQQAAKVQEHAPAAVVHAVESGDVSVADAASVAELPKADQSAALKKVKAGKAKTLRAAAPKKKTETEPRHKSGAIKNDPKVFVGVVNHLGKAARMLDRLNDSAPAEKFHRQALLHLNSCLTSVKEWQRALR